MSQIVKPSWELFDQLVNEASQNLIICAPWITSDGIRRIENQLLNATPHRPLPCVQFWARMADSNTDSPAILHLAKKFKAAGGSIVVRDSAVLHAKIYLADRKMALVTSANVSESGFVGNLEIAVVFSKPDEIEQTKKMLDWIQLQTQIVEIADLEYFVVKQRPSIVAQTPKEAPPTVVPIWKRSVKPLELSAAETAPGRIAKNFQVSKPVPLLDVIGWVEASLQAAQSEMLHVHLADFVGRKVRIWVCPTYVIQGPSPYLSELAALYGFGELSFGERLLPERFTVLEGTIEGVLNHERALFRQKRSRKRSIELTNYPDRGNRNALNSTDSRFLLRIEALKD